jgi:predicted enzyme related to lactoylglutathione lyase
MPAPTIVVGAPCWIDLYSSAPEKAKEFYGAIFGWSATDPQPEMGGYFTFEKDGKTVAGCMANDGRQGYPDSWTIHLMTDDAERTAAATPEHGGSVHMEPMAVAENGITTIIGDPGGATVGAWQPGTQKGFDVRGEVGTGSWFELLTSSYAESVDFYREVFGWDAHTASDSDELRYTTLGEGEGMLAGIMDASAFLPEGAPASWSVYFEVEDADAALEQIVELGGSIEQPAQDTPWGRLASAADPTGTRFKLIQHLS